MITCKEDLYGTVIEIKSSEDADFVAKLCAKFGIGLGYWSGCKFNEGSACAKISHNNGPHGGYLVFSSSIKGRAGDMPEFKNLKHLTLSDLKPRTKVEYEKVDFEPNEIWKAFKEHQEVGYLYVNTSDGFECLLDGVFNLAMAISQGDQLYRKVERPAEWWDDAVDYLNSNCKGVTAAGYCVDTNSIAITGHMNQEQCYDFARILLEQEGE